MVINVKIQHKPVEAKWTREQLTELFKSCDADKNGQLSFDEVKEGFKRLGSLNNLLRFFRAHWIETQFKAFHAIRHADANSDDQINLSDHELTELVEFVYNLGYKV